MPRQIQLYALACCMAAFPLIPMSTAQQAKQQCSAFKPSDSRGYWSWRLVGGRQCWYEGKPMLSKSLLEWLVQAPAQLDADKAPTSVLPRKPSNPLDSQAWLREDPHTFEARW